MLKMLKCITTILITNEVNFITVTWPPAVAAVNALTGYNGRVPIISILQ